MASCHTDLSDPNQDPEDVTKRKRSVASAHFTLHEAYCLRFLVLCPECEESVPKAKMMEHQQNEHQQLTKPTQEKERKKEEEANNKDVPLSMPFPSECAQNIVDNQPTQGTQTKECLEHTSKCKFCELTMHLSRLQVHEPLCGSRTERCPHCNQLILLHALAQHKNICQTLQAWLREEKKALPERKIQCDYCNQMIARNKCVHLMDKCRPISESVKYRPFEKPKIPPPSLPSQASGNQSSTVEKDVRPKAKPMNISTPRGKNRTTDLPWKSELRTSAASPTEEEAAYDILQRCHLCGILLPLPTLKQHQEKCQWLASSRGKQVRKTSYSWEENK
ncbi:XIAP-associated factor 1 isoform X2 [Castor canadensis]|uniref:XIAP-associated factor 1 isoform X2 n=1 Tax=Castor canadensis TaxID=51338 RepID=A0AC58KEC2_CASCN